jgi:hypothetical protein
MLILLITAHQLMLPLLSLIVGLTISLQHHGLIFRVIIWLVCLLFTCHGVLFGTKAHMLVQLSIRVFHLLLHHHLLFDFLTPLECLITHVVGLHALSLATLCSVISETFLGLRILVHLLVQLFQGTILVALLVVQGMHLLWSFLL